MRIKQESDIHWLNPNMGQWTLVAASLNASKEPR
jgi:hypothetical protein